MSFLVLVLVALIIRFTPWRKGFPLDVLGVWVARVAAATTARPAWQGLIMLVVPLVLVGLLIWIVDDLAYGVIALLTHALLLLLCVGRNDPLGSMLTQLEQAWQRGDQEAASLVAERDLDIHAANAEELAVAVRMRLVWEVCTGYLIPAFWYLLLGPLGAITYRLFERMQQHVGHPLQPLAASLTHALEWLPARLMALSMALVGRTAAAVGRECDPSDRAMRGSGIGSRSHQIGPARGNTTGAPFVAAQYAGLGRGDRFFKCSGLKGSRLFLKSRGN